MAQKPIEKKPKRRLDIWNRLAVLVLTVFLVACISVFFVLVNIINDPEGMRFSQDGLSTLSNSRMYDSAGELIYEFGSEIREDIEYEDIPQSVIDAFLSIEDSRYFTHNGFDLPRFMAAALANLKSGSFGQGGSTLTMQMIDNAFTKNQETKIKAENDGYISKTDEVKLKIQEIYLSLVAEQSIDKEEIFEYYVNRIWFGSGNNTRGIQKAAQYYFSKDVSELNLSEAAFLAGAVNSPYTYNPLNNRYDDSFDYYAAATERRNTTLALMLQHGYITQEEYDLASSTDLAFALDVQEIVTTDPNQAYIEQVINECIELTGQDPSVIPMDIYTALNQEVQAQADGICNGTITGYSGEISFPDEGYDIGFGIINNENGEIIAVAPGRYYHTETVKHDLSTTIRQPGSTMKPLLAYAPAFDILGWSTVHTVNDKAADYWKVGSNLGNSDGVYSGYISLERALGVSKNTPAAATMIELVETNGYDYWIEYCKRLGYDTDVAEEFQEQYVIGGASMRASPIQQASAYSSFANGGVRINAHRIRKVIRRSDKEEIAGNSTQYEIVSEQAAYMISVLLRAIVDNDYASYNYILRSSYPCYSKSGTTDWSEASLAYGIPVGVARDSWSVAYSSQYSIAVWSGYTPEYEAQGYYITSSVLARCIPFHIAHYMLDYCEQYGDYHAIERPDGVSDYNGGYIKTEFLEYGDTTTYQSSTTSAQTACEASGGTYDSESGICVTKDEEDEAETACTGSGGSYDNGACSCPDGYTLNGTACEAQTNTTDPSEQCSSWGGTWNGTYCEFSSGEENTEENSGSTTGFILPWFIDLKRMQL
jgi:penicillin-binding protein 1A